MTPHRCPVCEGRGTMPAGFYSRGTALSNTAPETCQSCIGQGVLWSQSEPSFKRVLHHVPVKPHWCAERQMQAIREYKKRLEECQPLLDGSTNVYAPVEDEGLT